MTSVYYKYAIAAIIGKNFYSNDWNESCELLFSVFDLSRPATFDAVTKVVCEKYFLLLMFTLSGEMMWIAK